MVKNENSALFSTLSKIKNHSSLRGAEWIGIRENQEISTDRIVRDGKPQINHREISRGWMVEVLAEGQFAYVSTPRQDEESLIAAGQLALQQAKDAAKYSVYPFDQSHRPKVEGQFEMNPNASFTTKSVKEVEELLIEISHCLKISPDIIKTIAGVSTVEITTQYVSTNGSHARQSMSLIGTHYSATAKKGNIIQKRSGGRSTQNDWSELFHPHLFKDVERVANQALELTAAESCPTEVLPLLLAPDQMMLQIHESIGHPLELDRILGDERNYAGWSFIKKEDFGTLQYGSPLMNVTFDPTLAGELASYAFDDTGNPAVREYLIKEGRLVRGLGGLESQTRLSVPGVANMRATSWNRAPIDRMANLNLEPGTSSLDEMISTIERGVYMETNRSWSIDDFRNKFQFGCEYAKLIENGKFTKTLRDPNYRGITVPFWQSLRRVGGPETFQIHGTPNCGKGEPNQVIRVGHASPVCLFENVEVFGGGE